MMLATNTIFKYVTNYWYLCSIIFLFILVKYIAYIAVCMLECFCKTRHSGNKRKKSVIQKENAIDKSKSKQRA
jgi:hypothetical protein